MVNKKKSGVKKKSVSSKTKSSKIKKVSAPVKKKKAVSKLKNNSSVKKSVKKKINTLSNPKEKKIKTSSKSDSYKTKQAKLRAHLSKKIKSKLKNKVIDAHNLKKNYDKNEFNPFERVHSGIPGFDELCEGGFAKNSINLLGGDAGSGKSLFAMQFIVRGIEQFNENGVYISFEESREVVFERMKQYGWDLEQLEKDKRFVYLQYTPEQVEQVLEAGGGIISDVVHSIGAQRVVFDSLTAFTFLFETEFKQRSALLALFAMIRKWGCTALLIAEEELDIKSHKANIMEFESDADILIYNILMENKREHVVEIYKMRGTNHLHNIYPMMISRKGIEINNTIYIQQM